jgi:cell division protein FtsL
VAHKKVEEREKQVSERLRAARIVLLAQKRGVQNTEVNTRRERTSSFAIVR